VDRRAFVSRTGHRIELLETARADNGIVLETGDGKLGVTLDQKKTEITLHSDGSVTVDAQGDVTVKSSSGTLRLEGQEVQVSGRTGVTVDGGAKCTIRGTTVAIN
jgi:hypothetical protein